MRVHASLVYQSPGRLRSSLDGSACVLPKLAVFPKRVDLNRRGFNLLALPLRASTLFVQVPSSSDSGQNYYNFELYRGRQL